GLMLCFTGPLVVGGLFAGLVLDRYDRRQVMIVDNTIRGAAMASIPLLFALGRLDLWQIYVVAAVYGFLMMLSLAGGPSLVPSRLRPRLWSRATARELLGFPVGGVSGPPLAGLLIAPWGGTERGDRRRDLLRGVRACPPRSQVSDRDYVGGPGLRSG